MDRKRVCAAEAAASPAPKTPVKRARLDATASPLQATPVKRARSESASPLGESPTKRLKGRPPKCAELLEVRTTRVGPEQTFETFQETMIAELKYVRENFHKMTSCPYPCCQAKDAMKVEATQKGTPQKHANVGNHDENGVMVFKDFNLLWKHIEGTHFIYRFQCHFCELAGVSTFSADKYNANSHCGACAYGKQFTGTEWEELRDASLQMNPAFKEVTEAAGIAVNAKSGSDKPEKKVARPSSDVAAAKAGAAEPLDGNLEAAEVEYLQSCTILDFEADMSAWLSKNSPLEVTTDEDTSDDESSSGAAEPVKGDVTKQPGYPDSYGPFVFSYITTEITEEGAEPTEDEALAQLLGYSNFGWFSDVLLPNSSSNQGVADETALEETISADKSSLHMNMCGLDEGEWGSLEMLIE